jgi:hypothetical protein
VGENFQKIECEKAAAEWFYDNDCFLFIICVIFFLLSLLCLSPDEKNINRNFCNKKRIIKIKIADSLVTICNQEKRGKGGSRQIHDNVQLNIHFTAMAQNAKTEMREIFTIFSLPSALKVFSFSCFLQMCPHKTERKREKNKP